MKGLAHIRHPRYVPVLDVPVGGKGGRLVGTPQVDSGLEVGVDERGRSGYEGRPVVVPVGIGREGGVNQALVGV